MRYSRNERGYVLMVVLLIIVIITTFAIVLIPKALSTSLQVNKSEKVTRTKELAEMGVQYSNAFLRSQVTKAIEQVKTDPGYTTTSHDKLFCERLKTNLSNTPFGGVIKMDANSNYYFQVAYLGNPTLLNSNNSPITTCDGFNSMKVPIQSIGKLTGSDDKEIKAYFTIDNNGEIISNTGPGAGPVDPNTLSFVSTISNSITLSGNGVSQMYSSSHFLSTSLITIKGNGRFLVGGNAWIESNPSIDFRGINGVLAISGNAYFKNPVSLGGNGSNYICVKGNAYLLNSTTKKWENYTEIKADKSTYCPSSIENTVQYYYDVNRWDVDNQKLDVQY